MTPTDISPLRTLAAENWRALTREWLGPELLGPSVGEMGALFVAAEEDEESFENRARTD